MEFNIQHMVIVLAQLILAVTIHEFAHAYSADRLGDPTPRRQGRISLLPPDHLDPIGTVMMVITTITGFGIGWGKPVMVNPGNFRNPRRDHGMVAAAGPLSNVVMAVLFALTLRFGLVPEDSMLGAFILMGVVVNLSLFVFNLLPISPLDGSSVVTALLPYDAAMRYRAWMQAYGLFVFLGLVLLFPRFLSMIIGPPVSAMMGVLLP
ncbi:MAG TPA: site-2 protease family protein [Chthonomonadales bacterium]|nr:site-2 protease family protein [Chthonomonadales bacterium]